jgi:hypothetical protein
MCGVVDENYRGRSSRKIVVTFVIERDCLLWDWDEAPKTKARDEVRVHDWSTGNICINDVHQGVNEL